MIGEGPIWARLSRYMMGKVQGEVFSIQYQVGELSRRKSVSNSSQRGTFQAAFFLICFETPNLPVWSCRRCGMCLRLDFSAFDHLLERYLDVSNYLCRVQ
jgi:hypothetical protein